MGAGELLVQTTRRDDAIGASVMVALVIAGALLLEALGAALVARGVVPVNARVLDGVGLAVLAALGLAALSPVAGACPRCC